MKFVSRLKKQIWIRIVPALVHSSRLENKTEASRRARTAAERAWKYERLLSKALTQDWQFDMDREDRRPTQRHRRVQRFKANDNEMGGADKERFVHATSS